MLTKNELKYYSSLLQKKHRNNEKKFLVEGQRSVSEALQSSYKCDLVIITQDYYSVNKIDIEREIDPNLRIEIVSNSVFNKLSDTKSPQGIVGIFHTTPPAENSKPDLAVALENISDPGNVGTIIRNCDWFGIKKAILSNDCADVYNPKVVRSTMGSLFHLDVGETENFYTTLKELQMEGYDLLCADMTGENVYEFKLNKKSVVVFCNEANGPTEKLLTLIDKKITIPKIGNAESLNVANASAVILSQLTRKV